MRNICYGVLILLALVSSSIPVSTLADGKVYINYEKVPPTIPYQRALIFHHKQTQTLILQSRYQSVEQGEQIGWIVPLPSPPEVGTMKPDQAKIIFSNLSRQSKPQKFYISDFFFIIFGIAAALYFILCVIIGVVASFTKKEYKIVSKPMFALSFAFLIFIMLIPNVGKINSSKSKGIHVLSEHDTGIYRSKIIEANSATDLENWLTTNGFAYDREDTKAFEEHIADGWCFAATTVKPPSEWKYKGHSEGLFAPLIFRFHAEQPIYPLALTATIGQPTTVLIYLVADQFFTAGERIEMHYAGIAPNLSEKILHDIRKIDYRELSSISDFDEWQKQYEKLTQENEHSTFIGNEILALDHLMKFKQELTAEEMKTDLIFRPTPEQKPFRRKQWHW